MAEQSPQPVNPSTDPQVENAPVTEVPVAAVDRAPAEVSSGTNPQVPAPQAAAVPAATVDVAPDPVASETNPQVPQPGTDLPEALVYPQPEGPSFDPIVIAQAARPTATDAVRTINVPDAGVITLDLTRPNQSTAVNRGPTSVPISEIGATPINPQPGVTEPRLIIDPNLPNVSTGTGGTTTVTAPRIVTDPSTVGIGVRDETGAVSNIRINPETGERYNAQGLPAASFPEEPLRIEIRGLPEQVPNDAPEAPPRPTDQPGARTPIQTAPAPASAQDYQASGDAAALEQAQQAENEAFRQGRIPQPVTDPPNPQTPTTDGTTAGPGITGQVPGVSPYGEADDIPSPPASQTQTSPAPGPAAVGDGTTAGPGITGQVPGISPYGEADDQPNVGDGTTAGPGITGPVPGTSPYGEADDPPTVDVNRDPVPPNPGPYEYIDNDPVPDPQPDPRIEGENVGTVRDQALRENARNQQAINAQRGNNRSSADWRVRLRLAPGASYLYNAPNPGILAPLSSTSGTGGVIFPYTPVIQTVHKANYNAYDLTHSNYRGYFYQSSQVEDINITATFTAQDTVEAEYLLAVIHFFRSVTKMFYGGDVQRGAPPPLVFLSGLGEFQYANAPCVVASFNYNLPADVDYIRARSPNQNATNLLKRRQRQDLPSFLSFSPSLQRLYQARLRKGGDPRIEGENVGSVLDPPTLGLNSPTYVPTRMEMTIILHPMQSRRQVSQDFSLREYSNGSLITRGFW